jgi:diguanylate cyclase (GGDEF)-like protein
VERQGRPSAVYRTYHRWVRISRLAIGAFVCMSVLAFLWLLPWLPHGLDTKDYSPQVGFTVYLLLSVAVLGIISLAVQERTRRNRESLMVWSTVYDETTGLHNRTYLFDRLALECERARRSGEVFSVIVLQIRAGKQRSKKKDKSGPLSSAALRKMAEIIDGHTHPTDMVALLSNTELAVLANRVDRESRHRLQERLGDAVAQQMPELISTPTIVDVKAGSATYGSDGTEPSTLVQAARTSASLGSARPRAKAA